MGYVSTTRRNLCVTSVSISSSKRLTQLAALLSQLSFAIEIPPVNGRADERTLDVSHRRVSDARVFQTCNRVVRANSGTRTGIAAFSFPGWRRMHEFRRGDGGEVRSSTRAAAVVSRDDTPRLLPPRTSVRDIAGSRERGDVRWKEIGKWPVKVLECGHVACSVSERGAALTRADFLHFHLVVLHPPSPVAASYSRSPGSIHRRTTFVLSLCPPDL